MPRFAGNSYLSDCVWDEAGNMIETHKHKGDFKEW